MTISRVLSSMQRQTAAAAVAALALGYATTASANLVQNSDFELKSIAGSTQFGADYPTQQLDNWTATGYNFIFENGTADTTGAAGQYGTLSLWGPNNGASNGLPSGSPTGGNFVGADGAFQVGAISQTITGLTPGQEYVLSFWWGGAQQQGFDGANTEQWIVSLGGETHSTAVVSNANHGFTGWIFETMTFTPGSTSELLSFLAAGTPSGEPPFSLLDGVTLDVPEPASMAIMGPGLVLMGSVLRRRRKV